MAPATGPLLKTVFAAISEVFLVCLAGWILARNGILDKKTQKKLNRINVSLFTPALLFGKVAFSLSPEKLRELWIIPLFFVGVTATSALTAWVTGWLLGLKRSQRNFAMAASMFNNSNSLPIALMQSLVVTVPHLKWGQDDTKDAMLGRALGYLVLYSTMGMVLRWSYGVHLLSQSDEENEVVRGMITNDLVQSPESPPFDPGQYPEPLSTSSSFHSLPPAAMPLPPKRGQTYLGIPIPIRRAPARTMSKGFFHSFPNSPAAMSPVHSAFHSSANSATSDDERDDDDDDPHHVGNTEDDEWGVHQPRIINVSTPPATRFQSSIRQTRHRLSKAWKGFNEFMTVPLWASAASIVVALIQPLQHTLTYHMAPVKGFFTTVGGCSIPVTLVVLGAYFYPPPPEENEETKTTTQKTVEVEVTDYEEEDPTRPDDEERMLLSTGKGKDYGTQGVTGAASSSSGTTPNIPSAGSTLRAIATSDASASTITLAASVREAFKMRGLRSSIKKKHAKMQKESQAMPGETKTVFAAIFARMILTPLIVLPLVAALAIYKAHRIFDDPVFVVSNVLLISAPPALTLAQITQAASGDAFERLISRTIFWSYCIMTPPLSLFYISIGLYFSRL